MRFTLHGARLIDATMDIPARDITVDGAQIQAINDRSEGVQCIDASDAIVMPGFIEVHTHGGGGFNLHTTHVEEIQSYARWVPAAGVTSFLIAVVGTPNALPEAQLRTAVEAIEQGHSASDETVSEAIGIHLEGPYINVKKRGAHPPVWLRTPTTEETESILELTKGYLKLITLAPELPGAHEMIRRLVSAGVTVSIGHTDADYEQTLEAIELGARHMTHVFNAMHQLEHRSPGPIAALMQSPEVLGELIADGVHVHPTMMNVLIKLVGPQRTIVITDSLAGAGLPEDQAFEFAGQIARVICGAARLSDGTLSGSVLTLDQALHNMLTMTHVSLSEASAMLSLNPARSAHVSARKGLLKSGYDADLLIYDQSLTLQATICRGKVAYATPAWRSRLVGDDNAPVA